MVLDPIPQPLPVYFFGSRPQPPTSPPHSILIRVWTHHITHMNESQITQSYVCNYSFMPHSCVNVSCLDSTENFSKVSSVDIFCTIFCSEPTFEKFSGECAFWEFQTQARPFFRNLTSLYYIYILPIYIIYLYISTQMISLKWSHSNDVTLETAV